MKIAIIGAGAIGTLAAAKLYGCQRVDDLLLVGRQEHVDAINANGLTVRSAQGEHNVKLRAATRLDKAYDLVIFTVKTQDLEAAYQDNHEFLEDRVAMTTQNGVQGANIISTHFDRDKLIDSIVMFGATYIQPGEITENFPGDWIIGKPYAPNDELSREVVSVLGQAFPTILSRDITSMKWLKLFVNFNNCLPALTGKPMQETFADLDMCALSVRLLKEGVELITRANIKLVSLPSFPAERILGLAGMPEEQAAGILKKTLTGLSSEPLYGSILQSILRGKASEIDFINGEVVQVARTLQVPAPLNERVVRLVHEVENTGRYFSFEEIKNVFNLT